MKHVLKILLVVLLAMACSEEVKNDPVTSDPAVTPAGIPLDDAVTKEIGAPGGSLTSIDGILDVTVPPGAVSSNTLFSIQPILNFCPGGMSAFRLLPAGLTFDSPVTLTFHYTDENVEGKATDFLGIAYQGSDMIWYRLPGAVINKVSKTLSVQANHFTDWADLSELTIQPETPAIPVILVNKTLGLHLQGAEDLPPLPTGAPANPSADQVEPPPLSLPLPFEAKWYVNGVLNGSATYGKITAGADASVTYKAPDRVPANNIVEVSAELAGFQWYDNSGQPQRFNQVILIKRIKIRSDEYDYTLHVEHQATEPCGYPGQNYFDAVDMNIHVKDTAVTITNIVNIQPTVNPATLGILGNCTMTSELTATGELNVISASGDVTKNPFDESASLLTLTLENKGATSSGCVLSCPPAPAITNPAREYDFTDSWVFQLLDSVQIVGDPSKGGVIAKLIPK